MRCGRTVFLFWLHLDSQSLRTVAKAILSASPCSLVDDVARYDAAKP